MPLDKTSFAAMLQALENPANNHKKRKQAVLIAIKSGLNEQQLLKVFYQLGKDDHRKTVNQLLGKIDDPECNYLLSALKGSAFGNQIKCFDTLIPKVFTFYNNHPLGFGIYDKLSLSLFQEAVKGTHATFIEHITQKYPDLSNYFIFHGQDIQSALRTALKKGEDLLAYTLASIFPLHSTQSNYLAHAFLQIKKILSHHARPDLLERLYQDYPTLEEMEPYIRQAKKIQAFISDFNTPTANLIAQANSMDIVTDLLTPLMKVSTGTKEKISTRLRETLSYMQEHNIPIQTPLLQSILKWNRKHTPSDSRLNNFPTPDFPVIEPLFRTLCDTLHIHPFDAIILADTWCTVLSYKEVVTPHSALPPTAARDNSTDTSIRLNGIGLDDLLYNAYSNPKERIAIPSGTFTTALATELADAYHLRQKTTPLRYAAQNIFTDLNNQHHGLGPILQAQLLQHLSNTAYLTHKQQQVAIAPDPIDAINWVKRYMKERGDQPPLSRPGPAKPMIASI